MTFHDFLSRFDSSKQRKGSNFVMVMCPAHDDDQPSLRVAPGDEGNVLISCKAGCTTEAVCSAMGLKVKDLFANAEFSKPAIPRAQATYLYRNAERQPIMRKHRVVDDDGKKRFFWEHFKDGQWVKGQSGAAEMPPLYCLPDVIRAAKNRGVIYLSNGEKAADRLRAEGVVATCAMNGESKTQSEKKFGQREVSYLEGSAMVIIVADKDDAGELNAKWIAELLLQARIPCQVVQSATSGAKDDAYDHLEAGYSLDQFVRRDDLEPSRYGMFGTPVVAKDQKASPIPWLLKPYIAQGSICMIDGAPGVGKSFLATAIATAVSVGAKLPMSDERCPQGLSILIHTEDSPEYVTRPRLDGFDADLSKIILFGDVVAFDLKGLRDFRTLIGDYKPEFVSLDPITAFIDAAIRCRNPDVDTHKIMDRINKTVQEFNTALVALRHLRKSAEADGDPVNSGYGDIAIVGKARSAIQVKRVSVLGGRKTVEINHYKSNLGNLADRWRYFIESDPTSPDRARFLWNTRPVPSDDQYLSDLERQQGTDEANRVQECGHWIAELINGKWVGEEIVRKKAYRQGWNDKVVNKAVHLLKVMEVDIKRRSVDDTFEWIIPLPGQFDQGSMGGTFDPES